MALQVTFYELIIPIHVFDRIWPGGFNAYKHQNWQEFYPRNLEEEYPGRWHDAHLARVDGCMSTQDIPDMITFWEAKGFTAFHIINEEKQWADFFIAGAAHNPPITCPWIKEGFDLLTHPDSGHEYMLDYVYYRGSAAGEIIGPDCAPSPATLNETIG